QFGSSVSDQALGISVYASEVYMVGWTDGVLPGQVGMGPTDIFVRKYDAQGSEVWTHQFGSVFPSYDAGSGISVDASGIYVVGYAYGVLPGEVRTNDTVGFLRKYDADGNAVWTRRYGTHDLLFDPGPFVSVGPSGVYVAAGIQDSAGQTDV